MDNSIAQEPDLELEPVASEQEQVGKWLKRIEDAKETHWVKQASDAEKIYRARAVKDGKEQKRYRYNIFYANVTTLRSAIYFQTPKPDVRRRFKDENPVGRDVSKIIERALDFSLDAYDFDSKMKAAVDDMLKAGRGALKVKYIPTIIPQQDASGMPMMQPDGTPYMKVAYEEVGCDYVYWRDLRIGSARVWDDVPWIAIRHRYTRDEMQDNGLSVEGMDYTSYAKEGSDDSKDMDNSAKEDERATVWEIWDKESKSVLWVAEGCKTFVKQADQDPLQLSGFFPIPKPMYAIPASDSLIPICEFEVYRDLVEELERVSQRIFKITAAMRAKGLIDGSLGDKVVGMLENDDNEFIAVENFTTIAEKGGLNNVVQFVPIDGYVKALAQLYNNREAIKQQIYEITGISDILRGQTVASETATAQRIKGQYGTLRIQERQKEVARFARDLLRMKSEIICSKFQPETLEKMTGIKIIPQPAQLPPPPPGTPPQAVMLAVQNAQAQTNQQAQRANAILGMMRDNAMREFNVDIETDSTVAADEQADKESVTELLQAIGQYMTTVGPMVMMGAIPADAARGMLVTALRRFKGAENFEDFIERFWSKPMAIPPMGGVPVPPPAAQTNPMMKEPVNGPQPGRP